MRSEKEIIENMQVVVLMGGLGTRLGSFIPNLPKAMADVNGVPFFDFQLKILKKFGFQNFLFLVGYQAKVIEDYYGNGKRHDVTINYSYDGERQLGTGGAVYNAMESLNEYFMLIYGDSFMDINYVETLYRFYSALDEGKHGLMVIMKNNDRYDKSNVLYKNQQLLLYDKNNIVSEMTYIDYGISVLSKSIFANYIAEQKDLSEILSNLSREAKLAAHVVTKRFYEIGKPKSLMEFRDYVHNRFETKHKAIFIDRDGVINKIIFHDENEKLDSPFTPEQFEYIEGVIEALRIICEKYYYVFIVTNQPAAAKGKVKLKALYDLNTWLIQDLQDKHIYVESINMCPHHPKGSEATQETFLIRNCECRKPKTGLLTEVMKTYNIDWNNSYMVGDSYTDIQAGKGANVKTAFIGNFKCDICNRLEFNKPDIIVSSLSEFALTL